MASRQPVHRLAQHVQALVHRAGYDVTRETFKRHFVRALHTHGVTAVIDIGANTGQFGRALRQAGYRGRIVSLEPLGSAFAALSASAASDPSWTVQRAAVSAEAGTLQINVAGNSVSSSVLPMLDRHAAAAPGSRYVATEDVPATTVDDLVDEHGLDPARTLLKIDVQGYEMSVLAGATKTLDQFVAVRTEMSLAPLYEGQALLPEILAHLNGHGLDLWFLEEGFEEPGTGRLLQLDGMFFRRAL